jgi:hypothetical protein
MNDFERRRNPPPAGRVMQGGLLRLLPFVGGGGGRAGIRIGIKLREAAGRDFQTDAMARLEQVGRGPDMDGLLYTCPGTTGVGCDCNSR